jgi:hypothetical protein
VTVRPCAVACDSPSSSLRLSTALRTLQSHSSSTLLFAAVAAAAPRGRSRRVTQGCVHPKPKMHYCRVDNSAPVPGVPSYISVLIFPSLSLFPFT